MSQRIFITGGASGLGRALALHYAREGAKVCIGDVNPEDGMVTEDEISAALDTGGQPDPDLLIRTSGEMRISNFMLWQAAYAEFVFLPCMWPDFDKSWLEKALDEFSSRTRRFGGVDAAKDVAL